MMATVSPLFLLSLNYSPVCEVGLGTYPEAWCKSV